VNALAVIGYGGRAKDTHDREPHIVETVGEPKVLAGHTMDPDRRAHRRNVYGVVRGQWERFVPSKASNFTEASALTFSGEVEGASALRETWPYVRRAGHSPASSVRKSSSVRAMALEGASSSSATSRASSESCGSGGNCFAVFGGVMFQAYRARISRAKSRHSSLNSLAFP